LLKKGFKPKPTNKTPMTKEYASDGNSVLDHLVSHTTGDAFTTSNLNSPNHPIYKFLNVDPVQTNVNPEIERSYNFPSPPSIKSPDCMWHASLIHLAAQDTEIPNTIIISELDKQTPIQTSMPEQPIHNVETPQPEPHVPQPEQTQNPTSEQCDDIPSDNQEHHIPKSPVHIEIIENDTPPSSPMPFGPAYKPLTLDEITIPSDQMLSIMENIIM
jgi:hypothetical protein